MSWIFIGMKFRDYRNIFNVEFSSQLGNFFLGDPFLYFKYWNSGTVDFYINGFNMKSIRLLNATRCSFLGLSSLATLVATFVFWTHVWSHWPRLSRCSTDCQTMEFRRFDQLQIQSFMFFIIIFTFLFTISLILGEILLLH